ncbi:MAG: Hsp33 family molecular chaperone HslO [Oscillospiraceae bacterium]|nr:Hsp33 family molecular chaperone HslO [Oscillospiraceae bacterium]
MDRMIRCITESGNLRAFAVDSTYMVATAQQIHMASPTATAALGRLLTGASMMGAMLKNPSDSLQIRINGGGPLGDLVAIANSEGNCRGYMSNPKADLPLRSDGKLDVGKAVGHDGFLNVMRNEGHKPYTGRIKLISGEIAEDLAAYYAASEQIPTVCALGVLVGKENSQQVLAGGLLVQALPGVTKAELDKLEKGATQLPAITEMLSRGLSLEDICAKALAGMPFKKLKENKISYVCNCSKDAVERALLTLKPEEIRSLADKKSGFAEARCNYCGKKYQFTVEELNILAGKVEKRQKK